MQTQGKESLIMLLSLTLPLPLSLFLPLLLHTSLSLSPPLALGDPRPDVSKTLLTAPLELTHSPLLTPTHAPRTTVRKIATLKSVHPRGACGFHLTISLELTDDAPSGSLMTKNPPPENVYVFRALAELKRLPPHLSLALSLPLSPLMALPTPLSLPMSLTLSLLLPLPLQLPLSLSLALPLPLYLPLSLFLSVSLPSSDPLSLSLT